MTGFDTFAMVDWAAGNDRGPAPKKDAIWACVTRRGRTQEPVYLRNRQLAEEWLAELIAAETGAGRRLCLGLDFPFGYPAGFAAALVGRPDPLALWDWFEARVADTPKANNRFDLAGEINRQVGKGRGPFWFNGLEREIDGLPRRKTGYTNPFPEFRVAERRAKGTFSCWQMGGAGAVGGQVFTGLPMLSRLRRRFAGQLAVWPFEPPDRPVLLVEIWPSLIGAAVRQAAEEGEIPDAAQVRVLARALAALAPERLERMLEVPASEAARAAEEGWILGLGFEAELSRAALALPAPPPLRNDCFALPPGVDWTPVADALALLRERLHPVAPAETVPLRQALDRVLAEDAIARRSNPPRANSAVDGYGFAGPAAEGAHVLPLVAGRAAAGAPFAGTVPPGMAIRILTGAALPGGVDTVVLEEDVTAADGHIAFRGPLKKGANARAAGEDVAAGTAVLAAGRRLTPADLALLAAVGIARVPVRRQLRVAVISTGDELADPGEEAGPDRIYDANRPMLLGLAERMGFAPLDMGRVADDRAALRARLDRAAEEADVILTSGGASAGDEDHVSALLRESGAMQRWRIAIKPGRPLALAMWNGRPVFGLPGNPVAAMVCTLVFAYPAMALMAGMGWQRPRGFELPAAFEKRKKPGRREYLRARIRDGRAEVFHSEGSGRISGLSWAEGLVELDDGERHIRPGDPVRFIPWSGFGL